MKKMKSLEDLALVYSSETGKTCPSCSNAIHQCLCNKHSEIKGNGKVKVQLETKGRKGKGVTVIREIPLNQEGLKKLAKELKSKAGAGGSIKDGNIEIQGDKVKMALDFLEQKGFKAKKVGGR